MKRSTSLSCRSLTAEMAKRVLVLLNSATVITGENSPHDQFDIVGSNDFILPAILFGIELGDALACLRILPGKTLNHWHAPVEVTLCPFPLLALLLGVHAPPAALKVIV